MLHIIVGKSHLIGRGCRTDKEFDALVLLIGVIALIGNLGCFVLLIGHIKRIDKTAHRVKEFEINGTAIISALAAHSQGIDLVVAEHLVRCGQCADFITDKSGHLRFGNT